MTRWEKFVKFDMADENAGAFIFEISTLQGPARRETRSKHEKVQTNAMYSNTAAHYAHFRGNPLYKATERYLNNR